MKEFGNKILKFWPIILFVLTIVFWGVKLNFRVDAIADQQEIKQKEINKDITDIKKSLSIIDQRVYDLWRINK